jgi:hypothetical protein
MSRTPIDTYSDVLEFLTRLEGSSTDTKVKLMAQEAILSAYQELPTLKRWKYYYTRGRVKTDATYSTGTVTFDYTGGSSERILTLTGGTWPTNAARGIVLIDNVEYKVQTRVSDSIVTLSIDSNPGEDVASTTYNWWRDIYPLPVDFRGADVFIDHAGSWEPVQASPGTVLNLRANNQTANEPTHLTFISDPDYIGAMAVFFQPPPRSVYNFDFMYARSPMPMRILDYSTGTISVSSTTVTGTGTAWNDDMIGSLIRVPHSGVNQIPTGLAGLYPYAEQRVVTARASATSLTIDSAFDGTYSGVKYRISDFIDLDYHVMREAFRKLCEYRFAENLSRTDQGSRFRSYQISLQSAKEADGKRKFGTDCPAPVDYRSRFERGNYLGNDA